MRPIIADVLFSSDSFVVVVVVVGEFLSLYPTEECWPFSQLLRLLFFR